MNRRTLLRQALAGAAVAALPFPLRAQDAPARQLMIDSRTIEVNGRAARAFGIAGQDGRFGLSLDAGTDFDILLHNRLSENTLVHWHGLAPPWPLDGVPDMPAPLLAPDERRAYRFPVGSGGTHWMHAHTLQEQAMLAAPLIVRTPEDRAADELEVVVMLHDFSFTPAEEILMGLTGRQHSMNGGAMAMDDNVQMGMPGAPMQGMKNGGGMMGGMMMGGMGGMEMDLNDIDYDAYLANDRTLDDPEIVNVDRNGAVRLRIINGAAATAFTVDLGGLSGELIAVDGQPVVPLVGTRFPLSMSQRIDVRLRIPPEGGAFPILALREGATERTGIILATAGAAISRIAGVGDKAGPVLDLDVESRLSAVDPLAVRPADRSFTVHLAGNMASYSWAMHGADAIKVRRGDRVELTMMNMSMMAHPMHLHGHHFQIVAIDGERFSGARRDTVMIPPMRAVTVAVDADNPGRWAFHCHHLYHMVSGMMATFQYEDLI
jgi:FtsP/CotA-like multicopper oxidase with cupredoxin domain